MVSNQVEVRFGPYAMAAGASAVRADYITLGFQYAVLKACAMDPGSESFQHTARTASFHGVNMRDWLILTKSAYSPRGI